MWLSHFSCSFVYWVGKKKMVVIVRSTKYGEKDWGTEDGGRSISPHLIRTRS